MQDQISDRKRNLATIVFFAYFCFPSSATITNILPFNMKYLDLSVEVHGRQQICCST